MLPSCNEYKRSLTVVQPLRTVLVTGKKLQCLIKQCSVKISGVENTFQPVTQHIVLVF